MGFHCRYSVVEDSRILSYAPRNVNCPRMAECRTYPLWYKLDGMISEYLDSVTLADLMQYPDAGNEYVI